MFRSDRASPSNLGQPRPTGVGRLQAAPRLGLRVSVHPSIGFPGFLFMCERAGVRPCARTRTDHTLKVLGLDGWTSGRDQASRRFG